MEGSGLVDAPGSWLIGAQVTTEGGELVEGDRNRFPPIEVGVQISREVDGVAGAGILLRFEPPFFDFDRNQGNIARARRAYAG
jgi:hypothetical protein